MPSVAPSGERARSGSQTFSLAAVFSASFGVGLIFGFQPPLMALVLERGGASSFEIGAVTSISTVAVMLCGPLYPRAIARLGLRPAIILGIVVSTAMMLVMPWLPGFAGWLVLRFITGCALGLEWIASETWLNRLSTDQSRLARAAPTVMVAALIAGLVESAYVSLLPVFALLRGLDEQHSLVLVTVFLAGNVILQLPIGRLGDRLGRQRVLRLCAVVCVIGPILLSAVMGIAWLVWPLLLTWGGTMYGFYTQGIALLGESYPAAEFADANTVFVVVYCAGGIVGPSLGGLAMDYWSPNGLLVFLSAAPLLLGASLLRRERDV